MRAGARGDASTDNTTAIQTAENALYAAGGGTLYFPAGTYLTGLVQKRAGVTWLGDGPGATIIKLKSGTNDHLIVDYNWQNNLTYSGGPYFICDLTLDGNKANNSAGTALTMQCFGSRLMNVDIQNAYNNGICLSGQTRNGANIVNTVPNNRFEHVHITGCRERAFYGADSAGSILADAMFLGCIFSNCGDAGYDQIVIDRAAGFTFCDCRWYSGYRGDLNLSRTGGTQITACDFELNATEAANNGSVYANITLGFNGALSTVSIIGNVFWNNTHTATATDSYYAIYATSAQNSLAIVGNGFRWTAGTNPKVFQNNGSINHNGYFSDNNITGYTLPDDLGSGVDRINRGSLATRRWVYGNDFTTFSNNFTWQPSGDDQALVMGMMPNGSGSFTRFAAYGVSDPDNSHFVALESAATYQALNFDANGTGVLKAGRIVVGGTLVMNFPADAGSAAAKVPLCADAGLSIATRTVTSGTTILDGGDGVVIADATSGNVTLTLPGASIHGAGRSPELRIRRSDATGNTVTVQRPGGNTLNGGASETLAAGIGKIYVSDGVSAWFSW